ncbi:hypothetical protein DL240_04745 [Lujinxingia litoralis]|uniref:Lipoprotein n=2 Tax=Lujinxingia litoralis TaxID=2211119 RepID=A0A328CBF4_9DELT|nr:hypothetical protein DL240_04745 [Lujinxingia litoralis]
MKPRQILSFTLLPLLLGGCATSSTAPSEPVSEQPSSQASSSQASSQQAAPLKEWQGIDALRIRAHRETHVPGRSDAMVERCDVIYMVTLDEEGLLIAPNYEDGFLQPTADPDHFARQESAIPCMVPAFRVSPGGDTLDTDAEAFSKHLTGLLDHHLAQHPELLSSERAPRLELMRGAASVEALNARALALWENLSLRPDTIEGTQSRDEVPCPEELPAQLTCTRVAAATTMEFEDEVLATFATPDYTVESATFHQQATLNFRSDQPMFATAQRRVEHIKQLVLSDSGDTHELRGETTETMVIEIGTRQKP